MRTVRTKNLIVKSDDIDTEAKLLTFYKIINGYLTVPIDDLNP